MNQNIVIHDERLIVILNEMRQQNITEVLTTKIIEKYMGGFHSNIGVPATVSWNAQFGKYLKRNAEVLGIVEIQAKQSVIENNHPTTSSLWSLYPNDVT